MAQILGDFEAEAQSLLREARARSASGYPSLALSLCLAAREILVHCGHGGSDTYIAILDIQADVHLQKTEYEESHCLNEEVARLTSPTRSPFFHLNALINLAWLDIVTGADEQEIFKKLDTARTVATRLEWGYGVQYCELITVDIYLRRGDLTEASRALEQCLPLFGSFQTNLQLHCLRQLAEVSYEMRQIDQASRWVVMFLALGCKTRSHGEIYHALQYLGDVFTAQDDDETTLDIFQAVLDGTTEMDVHHRRANCMTRIGDILERRGDLKNGKEMWESARPLFILTSQMGSVEGIRQRILGATAV
ncbi:hypothetical protein DFH09DRAFT_574678 [Mycena vulgaris]|nr:hypothetical protein DFH09DRAFT_574678 [Mycena vulgaris]